MRVSATMRSSYDGMTPPINRGYLLWRFGEGLRLAAMAYRRIDRLKNPVKSKIKMARREAGPYAAGVGASRCA